MNQDQQRHFTETDEPAAIVMLQSNRRIWRSSNGTVSVMIKIFSRKSLLRASSSRGGMKRAVFDLGGRGTGSYRTPTAPNPSRTHGLTCSASAWTSPCRCANRAERRVTDSPLGLDKNRSEQLTTDLLPFRDATFHASQLQSLQRCGPMRRACTAEKRPRLFSELESRYKDLS